MSCKPRAVEAIAPDGRWRAWLTALVVLVLGIGWATVPARGATATTRHEFSRILMGTKVRVVLWCGDRDEAKAAAKAALDRIAELDRVMSDWNRESELARLEARAGAGPVPVSADLADALAAAVRFAEASEGAFDPTVAPIVRLWRAARSTGARPDDAAMAAAREHVGWRRIALGGSPPTAALEAGTSIDLGAIGKGIAADEAMAVLERLGIEQALVDVGGSVRAGAAPPDDDSWTIAATADATHFEPLRLVHAGVATSGDLEQFVEIDGVRYSHIVDPRSGSPLTERIAVTVVATDALDADALSTAASVLEPRRAKALVERFGAAAIIQRVGQDGEVERIAVGSLPPDCSWPAFDAVAPVPAAAVANDGESKAGPESFIRARAEGRIHALELATWTMTRSGAPTVRLVGVVHIGEPAFYERLQQELAANDLVLFESVMPEAALPPHGDTPDARIASTRQSLELLADLDARVRRADGAAPPDLDALAAAAGRIDSRMGPVARAVSVDAWGHRVEFRADVPSAPPDDPRAADGGGPSWQFRSLGRDGRPGGEGEDADIEVAPLPTPTRGETDIQRELARTLGLAHQIES
ncbi:MAG: FAD:protein FMN transferase, partial [Phycisphaerales bacterium]|nr:FAD:protein FMN transferase [Phycisphaerales bacterium]